MADASMKKKFHDPLTYRYPRSMEEAFGPYERDNLYHKEDKLPGESAQDKIAILVSAIIALTVVAFTIKSAT
jgi:hypothetical protein